MIIPLSLSFSLLTFSWLSSFRLTSSGKALSIYVVYLLGMKLIFVLSLLLLTLDWFALLLSADFRLCLDPDRGKLSLLPFYTVKFLRGAWFFSWRDDWLGGLGGTFFWLFWLFWEPSFLLFKFNIYFFFGGSVLIIGYTFFGTSMGGYYIY